MTTTDRSDALLEAANRALLRQLGMGFDPDVEPEPVETVLQIFEQTEVEEPEEFVAGPAVLVTRVVSNPKTGESFETALSDMDALEACRDGDKPFGRDLWAKYRQYRRLSAAQMFWVHKLALEITGASGATAGVDIGDFSKIKALFEIAGERLKHPRVTFEVSGHNVVLSVAGDRSKAPGSVNVTDGLGYGKGKWFGRIGTDGRFTPGRHSQAEIVEFLKEFAADPAAAASQYGRRSGRCCFCNRQLTDPRSVAAGFGETCAENHGLQGAWAEAAGKA